MSFFLADWGTDKMPLPPYLFCQAEKFSIFRRNLLHLWKFAVISNVRSNFSRNARNLTHREPRGF